MNESRHGGTELMSAIGVSHAELEREQLIAYLKWGEAPIPGWWLVSYAGAITLWFASHDLDRWMTIVGSLAFVGAMALLTHYITSRAVHRTGVTLPRFSSMPAPLRRAYLRPFLIALALFAVAVLLVAMGRLPVSATLIGLFVGPMMALATVWATRRFRRVAARLAREAGVRP